MKQISKLKKPLLGIVIAVLVFWIFGFLGLPPLLKHFAAKALSDKFHRPVMIEAVHVNPLNLSLRINGFSMLEQGGAAAFFSIDELYVDLELDSLLEGAPVVQGIQVKAPYIHIVRLENATYNVDDILAELLKPSDSPAKYSINNIQLEGGKVEFDDRPKQAQHVVSDIQLAIPFLSNLAYEAKIYVKPDFSAKVNGSPLHLAGQMKPFSADHESTLAISLSNLDLARYVEYAPLPAGLGVPSAHLDTRLNISFSQPPKQSPTINLSGTATLSEVVITEGKENASLVQFSSLVVDIQTVDVTHRKVNLKSVSVKQPEFPLVRKKGSEVVASAEEIRLTGGALDFSGAAPVLSQPVVEVSTLRMQRRSEKTAFVEVAAFALKDVALDMNQRSISLGELSTSGGSLSLRRDKHGVIDLLVEIFGEQPSGAKVEPTSNQTPFQFLVKKLSLAEYAVKFADATHEDPVNLAVDGVKIDIDNLSNQKDSKGKLALTLGFNKTGTFKAEGDLGINPLITRLALDFKGIRLKAFQPYFTDKLNIIINDGTLLAKGELKVVSDGNAEPKITFNGDAGIDRLATVDKLNEDDFLKWNRLRLNRVSASTQPLRLTIAEIVLSDFYSRMILHSDGTLNLQQIVKKQGEQAPVDIAVATAEATATPSVAAKPPAVTPAPAERPPVAIGKITLSGGQVEFSDYFIKPNYSANMTELGGEVKGLSSDASTTAEVAIKGRVDNQGRLDISGRVNPLSRNLSLDLLAKLNDFELSALTPYSSKYAGYGITKGKLTFDVKYKVEDRKLSAENHLFLNQLTFGDKVDSPDATSLPVMLAVALLRDSKGNIDINLPVSGSLDDPEFSVGGIIIKVIVNLVVKAVTAPFALIGSMFGGGEEMAYYEFDYGRSSIPSGAVPKLDNLAKALQDRPGLKLDISGQVDPDLDREGLKQAMLERHVKAQKFNDLRDKSSDIVSIEQVRIEPAEYALYLTKAYKQEKIPNKPRNLVGMTKDVPVAEMEKLMLANFQVSDNDLRELVNHRALAAKEYLIGVGKVEPERVFIVVAPAAKQDQVKEGDKGKRSRVDFVLGTS